MRRGRAQAHGRIGRDRHQWNPRDDNRLARPLDLATREAFPKYEQRTPGDQFPDRAAQIESGDPTRPHREMTTSRKDERLILEAAERGGCPFWLSALLHARRRCSALECRTKLSEGEHNDG